jgi:hypothetical protein
VWGLALFSTAAARSYARLRRPYVYERVSMFSSSFNICPDVWVILRLRVPHEVPLYKVLAGWYGGYLERSSWRLNSGITRADDAGSCLLFHGYSGSTYTCAKSAYGTTALSSSIYQQLALQLALSGVELELLDQQTAISLSWLRTSVKDQHLKQ